MSASQLYVAVMAGGSGTRFWPKSTAKKPKQLLSFNPGNSQTLLEQTLARFSGLVPASQQMIVTTRALAPAIKALQLGAQVMGEPEARNTAPCVYWAAQEVYKKNPEAILALIPADAYMARPDDFIQTFKEACLWAQSHDDLITLGIEPTRPETGYGYLRLGEKISGNCVEVAAFVEKPNAEKAAEFLRSKKYLWNGGMFVWRAEVIIQAFDTHMPEMKRAWDSAGGDLEKAYPLLTATSIDFGIMEKAKNVVTFPLDCGWDDLGLWLSLETVADALGARRPWGVTTAGEGVALNSSGLIVDTPGKFVAALGVKDLIIVDTGKVLLVADKHSVQDIKKLIEIVKSERPELL